MYDTEHTRILFSHFATAPRNLWNITWIISQTISRSPDSLRYNQLGPHGPFFTIWALLIVGQRPGLLGPPRRPNVLLCGVDFLLLVCLFPLLSIKSGGLSVRVERRCTSCRLVLRQFYADDNGLFVGVRISLTSCICVITESGQYHCTGIWRQSRKWKESRFACFVMPSIILGISVAIVWVPCHTSNWSVSVRGAKEGIYYNYINEFKPKVDYLLTCVMYVCIINCAVLSVTQQCLWWTFLFKLIVLTCALISDYTLIATRSNFRTAWLVWAKMSLAYKMLMACSIYTSLDFKNNVLKSTCVASQNV